VAGLIWSYPLEEVNRYTERLVDAGFEDRVMFGTDQMGWPGLMAYSISLIQNADYLTPEQSRDPEHASWCVTPILLHTAITQPIARLKITVRRISVRPGGCASCSSSSPVAVGLTRVPVRVRGPAMHELQPQRMSCSAEVMTCSSEV